MCIGMGEKVGAILMERVKDIWGATKEFTRFARYVYTVGVIFGCKIVMSIIKRNAVQGHVQSDLTRINDEALNEGHRRIHTDQN